jgi:hypothetical protein
LQGTLSILIFDDKSLIGKVQRNGCLKKDIKLWPFKEEAESEDKPLIVAKYKGKTKKFYSEVIL